MLEHRAFHFVARAHVRGHLEQAAAPASLYHGLLYGLRFVGVGPGARRQTPIGYAVAQEPRGGEANRAAFDRFLHQIYDSGQFPLIRLHAFVATLVAHGLEADGGVADQADHVQGRTQRLHRV